MFGLQTLDLVIGLLFIYLLLSLVCTAVNEAIAAWLHLRAGTLRSGIHNLLSGFGNEASGPVSRDTLYDHPLIKGLEEKRLLPFAKRWPSYIPSRTFVLALLDLIKGAERTPAPGPLPGSGPGAAAANPAPFPLPGAGAAAAARRCRDIHATVSAANLPPQLKQALIPLIDDAQGDLRRLQENLERWFNDAMERVSAAYKRKAQLITFVLALLVTLALNADTLRIARALSSNGPLREALVAQARQLTENPAALGPGTDARTLRKALDTLTTLNVPLGWQLPAEVHSVGERLTYYGKDAASRWAGLLITAFALMLGAPFWFDTLNKIVNVRAAGRAPEEKPKSPEALPPARGA